MSEEIPEEPMVDSEEEEVPELTIEDRQDALEEVAMECLHVPRFSSCFVRLCSVPIHEFDFIC